MGKNRCCHILKTPIFFFVTMRLRPGSSRFVHIKVETAHAVEGQINSICHQDSRYADYELLIYYGFSSNSFPVFFLFGLGLRQFIWGPTLSVSQNQVILRWLHTISRWLHEFYFMQSPSTEDGSRWLISLFIVLIRRRPSSDVQFQFFIHDHIRRRPSYDVHFSLSFDGDRRLIVIFMFCKGTVQVNKG